VDVGQRPEELIDVELNLQHGHCRLQLVEIPRCAVHGFGDVFEDKIEVNFIFLQSRGGKYGQVSRAGKEKVAVTEREQFTKEGRRGEGESVTHVPCRH
jgi:hypothetical protein